jgi:multidrug resistance efflux pump
MNKIALLLGLQKQVRDAQSIEDIGFVIANKTHDLIAYKQAIFWTCDGPDIDLKMASGSVNIDKSGPYALWLKNIIKKNKKSLDFIQMIGHENDVEWGAKAQYSMIFKSHEGRVFGGLWIECDKELSDEELSLLQEVRECYEQSLGNIILRKSRSSYVSLFGGSKFKKLTIVALIVAFFCPVQLSMTAPVEVVASHATTISMPFDGVIDDVVVRPGDVVIVGQELAQMDKTQLQSDFDRADQKVIATQSSLSRTGFESLRSGEKKEDLQKLRSEIDVLKIERKYAQKLLNKTEITTPVDGVAVFSDASALKGKALATGEKIMVIADPKDAELLVRIPAQSLLPIGVGDGVSFFLNQSPLKSYDAKIAAIGYESSMDVDGLLTYKIRAQYDNALDLRIGWQGTAKIKSHWSIFGYSLLRKPLIALRNLAGF